MSEPVIAGAALAFSVLSAGISEMRSGDVHFTGPSSPIGVTATNVPAGLRLRQTTVRGTVFEYHKSNPISGIEQVNVQLDCILQFDGPQVQATFQMPHSRSRLTYDTYIRIENPLSLERLQTPDEWVRLGINEYPVVRIPISVFVDHPWPRSNLNDSFMLVISGMTGFGAGGHEVFEERNRYWN
jgi:hypothetical protein